MHMFQESWSGEAYAVCRNFCLLPRGGTGTGQVEVVHLLMPVWMLNAVLAGLPVVDTGVAVWSCMLHNKDHARPACC